MAQPLMPHATASWLVDNTSLTFQQIAIFRGPILRVSRTRNDAHRQIRETVIHELGHYFGLSDEEMVF